MINKIKGYRAKILSSLLLILTVLSLCACATNKKLEINEEVLEPALSGMITYVSMAEKSEEAELIKKMDIEELKGLLKSGKAPFTAQALVNAVEGYEKIIDGSGAFVDVKSVDFNSGEQEINARVGCQFEKRIVNVNAIIDKNGIIRSLSFAPEYTAAEIGQKALTNTVIGMCAVFLILSLIAFIISLLKYIPQGKVAADKGNAELEKSTVSTEKQPPDDEKSSDNLANDSELVAVITAAIMEFESLPKGSFVVREIRRREENRW